jgi:hypothetical protein
MATTLKEKKIDDEALRLRRERREQAIASFALEGITFSPDELAEMESLDEQGLSEEEQIAYYIAKFKQSDT